MGKCARHPAALSKGSDGGEGASWSSGGAPCGGQAGRPARAAGGSLPLCGGNCDSELWELGQQSSQRSMSEEAVDRVTPLCVLVIAALRGIECSKERYKSY